MPNLEGTSKKNLLLNFIVDRSGSMAGEKIGQVNASIREILQQIKDEDVCGADAELYVAVLTFSSGAKWVYNKPISIDNFIWSDLDANGITDMGEAFKELNNKYSKEEFFSDATHQHAVPVSILLTDGYPTDDYKKSLNILYKTNKWFIKSTKTAIAIGSDAKKEPLVEFTGNPESVFEVHNKHQLAKIIKTVTYNTVKIGSVPPERDSKTSKQDSINKKVKADMGIKDSNKNSSNISKNNGNNSSSTTDVDVDDLDW